MDTGLAYPYGLEVHDVEAESVVLKWQTTETNVQEFKVELILLLYNRTIFSI